MSDVYDFMRREYNEQLSIDMVEGSKQYKFILKNAESFPLNRMLSFINLKYNLSMKTSGYTYVTFRIDNNKNKKIFAVMYLYDNEPKFVCLSPTFESSKGEFRDGFITYDIFNKGFEKFKSNLSKIEESIRNLISKGKIILDYVVYPGESLDNVELTILSLKLLIASICLVLYKKENGILQVHTDKLYIDMIKDIYGDSIKDNKLLNNIYEYFFYGNYKKSIWSKINTNDCW